MKNRRKIKGEQNLRYNLTICKKNDTFDILNDISESVTLVQLMDSLGNVNHDISIVGHCMFYSDYKKALFFYARIVGSNMLSFHWQRTSCNVSIRILCC